MTDATAPRISCLLPVYNGEKFLAEAVASILAQTCRDFELIVVDDGSTDGTPDILRALSADERIRILTTANGGIVSALNAGLALCRGIYVARMDCDDVSLPDRFAVQSAYLDEHDGCVLVGGIARSTPVAGAETRYTTGGRHRRTDLSRFPPRIAVAMHPLIMVRRAALVGVGGYRPDYPHAEDYDLFIRLSAWGTIDNPPVEVLMYRRHEDAVSIRHLDAQEVSAVRAELTAIALAGHGEIEPWLVEPYARLRVFRRLQTVDLKRAKTYVRPSLGDLFDLRWAKLSSRRYWRLRFIIGFTLAKFLKRDIQAARRGARSLPASA